VKNDIICSTIALSVPEWIDEMTVCFLHGMGSSAAAFRAEWEIYEQSSWLWFLDGPEEDKFTSGRRWFPFTNRPAALSEGVAMAADFVEEQMLQRDLSKSLVFVGHSQGAMVCMELVRRRNLPIKEAWCYAGYLPSPLHKSISDKVYPTMLHIFSSDADLFIDRCKVDQTACFFSSKVIGVHVHQHISRSLPHNFSQLWLDQTQFTVFCNGYHKDNA